MTWWSRLWRRNKLEQDLSQELQFHIAERVAALKNIGLSEDQARRRVRQEFGGIEQVKEECRDAREFGLIEDLWRDLVFSTRMLRRSPLFAIVAISTLALGIGANTIVFTFLENIVLRSFPARDPQQLVALNWDNAINMSFPNYLDFRERNKVFSGLIASRFNPVSMSLQARENFRVWGFEVSGSYFETLGVEPELGRFFTPLEDKQRGANPVVVLSDRYWRSRLAADPHAVGRAIKINGYPFTIVGIAPPSFLGTEIIIAGDYWIPICMQLEIEPGNDWLSSRGSGVVWTMGRLKPGVSRKQAEADLNGIARQLARLYPNEVNPKAKFVLSRPGLIGDVLRGPITGFGVAFMIIAGLALLLACINLAAMLLARAADRNREFGIRLALGATRFQLLRQLMTENLMLALSGGLLGLAIAFGICHLFSSWNPGFDLPINTMLHPDVQVLLFSLAAALFTTLLFGLAPALQAVRINLIPSLKDEAVWHRFRRVSVRDFLVAGQIALSIILVICSALVVRSLQHALTLNLGFNPNNAVAVSFDLKLQGYNEARSKAFIANLLEKTAASHGLQSVAVTNNLPLRIGEMDEVISRADRPTPKRSEWQAAITYHVSPAYFETAGIKLIRGRDINDHDREGTPSVAVVNEALARLLYGNEDPLGKRLRLSVPGHDNGFEIIGVAETGKYRFLGEDPQPVVFLPLAQVGPGMPWTTLVARTRLPSQQATGLLRKAVLDLDPELTLFNTGSLKDQLSLPLFPARAAAIVLGAFGVLAMALAAVGLFALMAYTVARRRREIGIRMALGAKSGQVLVSVFKRTFVLCAAGISIGVIITLITARLLSVILYGVSPRDFEAYVSAILLMITVSLLACWNPAARAIRTDPARTLREE